MQNIYIANDNWINQSFFMHTAIALMCWPLYWMSPWIFGVAVSPYIIFLVLRPRQEYLLPLILHTWYGSQQRYAMLLACFIFAISHFRHLQMIKLHIIFFIYLLFAPFFIWYTGARISAFHSLVTGGVYEGMSYYLSFAPFFWAAIVFRRLSKKFFSWLMIFSLLIVVRGFFFSSSDDAGLLTGRTIFSYSRFHSWASVYLFVVCVWAFATKQKIHVKLISLIGSILFILGFLHIGQSLTPFHLAGAASLGVLILLCSFIRKKYPAFLHPWLLLIVATVTVFWAIKQYEQRRLVFDRVNYEKINVRNWSDFVLRLENKLYGDRAPVWTASLDAVRQQIHKSWLFVDPHPVVGELYRDDGLVVRVELQAHNMLLEAVRLYGIYGGCGLLLTFILITGLNSFRNSAADIHSDYAPVAAAAIGHVIFGYWGGQYLMIPAFSFTLYSLIGVCYRNQYDKQTQKRRIGVLG